MYIEQYIYSDQARTVHCLYCTSCFWCTGYLVEYLGLCPRPCPLHAGADAPVLQGGGALKSTQKAALKWRVCAELATNWRREAVNSTNGRRQAVKPFSDWLFADGSAFPLVGGSPQCQ